MTFDLHAMEHLGSLLSAGLPVGELEQLLNEHFDGDRSLKDLNDYRIGTRPWKKLRDEVVPTTRFLRKQGIEGHLSFPLDGNIPDAWLTHGGCKVGIELTRALGRTDYHLSEELVRRGVGRGFLGLRDDAPAAEFERALARDRVMFSPRQALETMRDGVLVCLAKKNRSSYDGMWLLIIGHTVSLNQAHWETILTDLRAAAAALPFDKIYLVGDTERAPDFRLK